MLFSSVRSILLRNISAIAKSQDLSWNEVARKAAQHLNSMTAAWFDGEAPTIGYNDPLCRWAYMFRHAAAQANLFCRVLIEARMCCKPFGERLTREEVSMVVLGGGPGTELLGLAKLPQSSSASRFTASRAGFFIRRA